MTDHDVAFGGVFGNGNQNNDVQCKETGWKHALDRDAGFHSTAAVFIDGRQYFEGNIDSVLAPKCPLSRGIGCRTDIPVFHELELAFWRNEGRDLL